MLPSFFNAADYDTAQKPLTGLGMWCFRRSLKDWGYTDRQISYAISDFEHAQKDRIVLCDKALEFQAGAWLAVCVLAATIPSTMPCVCAQVVPSLVTMTSSTVLAREVVTAPTPQDMRNACALMGQPVGVKKID